MESEEQQPTFGRALVSWETWEYPKHDRSPLWYLIAGVIAVLLILFALFTGSFPFAVIILMTGIIIFLSHLREPERIMVHITSNGVIIGHHFYAYKEIRDFSIVYDLPQAKLLYLDFFGRLHPLMSIPLEEVNPNEVREALMPYAVENLQRDEETLTDVLARIFRI